MPDSERDAPAALQPVRGLIGAGIEALRHAVPAIDVVGPDRGREAVIGAVREFDSLVFVRETQHRNHRAENLLVGDLHARVDAARDFNEPGRPLSRARRRRAHREIRRSGARRAHRERKEHPPELHRLDPHTPYFSHKTEDLRSRPSPRAARNCHIRYNLNTGWMPARFDSPLRPPGYDALRSASR